MSLTLHLGVIYVPYSGRPLTAGKPRRTARRAATQSTGDVAEILESKYGIMQQFFAIHAADIATEMENGLVGSLESLLQGAPPSGNPFASATAAIETRFKQFLAQRELDGKVPGVPTKAALAGVSHRFNQPYAQRASRPSFIDTGAYQANFKAWVD